MAQAVRQHMLVHDLEQNAPVMGIIVLQARQAEDRRPDVGVVGEQLAGTAEIADARTDDTQPSLHDLALEVAVIPGEVTRLHETARRIIGRRAEGRGR